MAMIARRRASISAPSVRRDDTLPASPATPGNAAEHAAATEPTTSPARAALSCSQFGTRVSSTRRPSTVTAMAPRE